MNENSLRQAGPEDENLRRRSLELRNALLTLHKTLIDSERVSFEKTMGEIQSPNHFLQLLTSDPWFAWLRPLSRLIVSIDEALDQKKPLTIGDVDALMIQSGRLLVPAEHGEGFSGHYFEALQRDPHVVLTHAELVRFLGPREPTGE
ncbi:MAG: hypothetical protein HY207_13225 [Nitrospirae bacterium]|nr:hypothetical protein [Nitrospirota bacterium]